MSNLKKIGLTTLAMMILTLGGKLFGFLKDVLIASKFGANMDTDAFFVAFSATGILTTLIWTSINTTAIPILIEIETNDGKNRKKAYINNLTAIIFSITAVLVLLGIIFSPIIVKIMALGFKGEQFNLAVQLTRIGFPKLLFTGIIGILIAYLHTEKKFKICSSIHIFSNIILVIYLLIIGVNFGLEGLMIASFISVGVQLIILLFKTKDLYNKNIFKMNIRDIYISKFFKLITPILLGTAVLEINIIVDKTIGSLLESGSISALNYASRINDLILGVFISVITTYIFPFLAKEANRNNTKRIQEIFDYGMEVILFVTIPATIGIIILAQPLVEIILQRGAFNPRASDMTSQALRFYAIGLVFMSIRQLITQVYYSMQDTKTPTINSIVSVVFNIILNFILVIFMDYRGLALATSISSMIASVLMIYSLKKKSVFIKSTIYINTCKMIFSAVMMGGVVSTIYSYLSNTEINGFISLMIVVGGGLISYLIICYITNVCNVRQKIVEKLKSHRVKIEYKK